MASGLTTRVLPTCANPSFTLGIPKCITSDKDLFIISAKGSVLGDASVNFSGIKIYSDASLISSTFTGGKYVLEEPVIAPAPVLVPVVEPEIIPEIIPEIAPEPTITPEAEIQTQDEILPEEAPVLFDISANQLIQKTSNLNIYFWLFGGLITILALVVISTVVIFRKVKAKKMDKINKIN